MEDDVERRVALVAFLRRGAGRPFAWGTCDCALWCSEWIAERRGVDPLGAYRGTYANEAGCRALVAAEGGLAALVSRRFTAAGLAPAAPAVGDVGLVGTLLGPALMIGLGDGYWVGKAPRGIRTLRAAASLSWRV